MVLDIEHLFQPMDPVTCKYVFNKPNFLYQVKWDGVRMLSYINKNQVKLINKNFNDRTLQYPELQQLKKHLKYKNAVLDGEIIAFKDGKPSFPAIMKRDRSSHQSSIFYMQKHLPVHYMIFDIVLYNSKDLTCLPLLDRQSLLHKSLDFSTENMYLVEDFDNGSKLLDAVKAQDMEGIVAKNKKSHYIGGKKHRDWFKVKYRRQITCVIGGYILRSNVISSLLLGLFREQELIYVGRAGSGLNNKEREMLAYHLRDLSIDNSPFTGFNPSTTDLPLYYNHPLLTVQIEFAEWTEQMHLRSPVIKGFSTAKPEECRLL